ncbi:MAG: nitroreductase family protein [Elusimicrobia bacterium]|nr:nitroreductase family protein [Elusimicrobiota bacterium]
MDERIRIDAARCTSCGLCVKVCFPNYGTGPDGKVMTRPELFCAACGHCLAVCPADAISHPRVQSAACTPLREADRPSYEQYLGFLRMRRSRREFKDQPVPREVIAKLLAAGAQAPNGLNRQNVHYTVITDRAVLKELSARVTAGMGRLAALLRNPAGRFFFRLFQPRVYRELEFFLPLLEQVSAGKLSGRDLVCYDAPCAILVHTAAADLCGCEDAVYAAANIQYAAETLGLGTCVVGFITNPVNEDKALRALVRLPAGHRVQTSLVVGYPQFRYAKAPPKAEPQADYVG